jgi:fructosamine-3-kinase
MAINSRIKAFPSRPFAKFPSCRLSILLALKNKCIVTVKEMAVGSSDDKVYMVMEHLKPAAAEGNLFFAGATLLCRLPQRRQILWGTD